MSRARATQVVTAFLRHDGKIAIVRRSGRVRTYQGKWSGISGYLPEGADPLSHALQEILEETGLTAAQLRLAGRAEPVALYDEAQDRRWLVHGFLFDVRTPQLRLDWEAVEQRWIDPAELPAYDCVIGLKEVYEAALAGEREAGGSFPALP